MVILGIDTSCDDTGVGLVRAGEVIANAVATQTSLHAEFGGVMPEAASREHLNVIDAVTCRALAEAGLGLDDVDAVAATRGPGLVGALLVGLNYARGLAWARDLPFLSIHHLEGHIASSVVGTTLEPPFLSLIASGGHTSLFMVRAWGDYEELGRTRDDAAGEAFDKVARLLGLPYPGGPALAELADSGDPAGVRLPSPLRGQHGFEFSFSGLKTAVMRRLELEPDVNRADLAASFQEVVVGSLADTLTRAAAATGVSRVSIAGGVAANRSLRARFSRTGLDVHFPPLALARDNGAMIALAAHHLLDAGAALPDAAELALDALPYFPLADARAPVS